LELKGRSMSTAFLNKQENRPVQQAARGEGRGKKKDIRPREQGEETKSVGALKRRLPHSLRKKGKRMRQRPAMEKPGKGKPPPRSEEQRQTHRLKGHHPTSSPFRCKRGTAIFGLARRREKSALKRGSYDRAAPKHLISARGEKREERPFTGEKGEGGGGSPKLPLTLVMFLLREEAFTALGRNGGGVKRGTQQMLNVF